MWLSGVLAVAIGVLFANYVLMWNARVGRCEKREDKLLDENSANGVVIKEQSALLIRAVDLIENSVDQGKSIAFKIEENGRKLDELKRELDELRRK